MWGCAGGPAVPKGFRDAYCARARAPGAPPVGASPPCPKACCAAPPAAPCQPQLQGNSGSIDGSDRSHSAALLADLLRASSEEFREEEASARRASESDSESVCSSSGWAPLAAGAPSPAFKAPAAPAPWPGAGLTLRTVLLYASIGAGRGGGGAPVPAFAPAPAPAHAAFGGAAPAMIAHGDGAAAYDADMADDADSGTELQRLARTLRARPALLRLLAECDAMP